MTEINIRPEIPLEYEDICELVKTAFETAHVSSGEEANLVRNIRGSLNYIPELSLVAERDGVLIGQVMLSKTTVTNENDVFPTLFLGPVCTLPEYRNNGLGGALINAALAKAKDMGHTAVFLAGDRNYYSRFGFVSASEHGIRCQHEVPPELLDNVMALELAPGALKGVTGIVTL
ncbi:MAG: N-acetyltransferase [Deltaproteobacteria bacterium]|jgi:putative acetyltransferase|nr:N-acetyltransferase [Deltaproteobacteria bacterium]